MLSACRNQNELQVGRFVLASCAAMNLSPMGRRLFGDVLDALPQFLELLVSYQALV